MNRDEVLAVLREDNPAAREQDLMLYGSIFMSWVEADQNIAANGQICAHPRTGAPMENPYVKVRAAALRDFAALKVRLRTDRLWTMARKGRW